MLKEATYKEKFVVLGFWIPTIIEHIKKDLKNDHLKRDPLFARHYFTNKDINKISNEEFAKGYSLALTTSEKSEELAEFIANRWLLKHTDLYAYFAEALTEINPNFQDLDELDISTATQLMDASIKEFGASHTYLFSVFNSVVFPKEIFTKLAKLAEEEASQNAINLIEQQKHNNLEAMEQAHQLQMARQADKYEKKLQGLQKKYNTDVALLKNQVANLQRKSCGKV